MVLSHCGARPHRHSKRALPLGEETKTKSWDLFTAFQTPTKKRILTAHVTEKIGFFQISLSCLTVKPGNLGVCLGFSLGLGVLFVWGCLGFRCLFVCF